LFCFQGVKTSRYPAHKKRSHELKVKMRSNTATV
jgi:hypothetical protein